MTGYLTVLHYLVNIEALLIIYTTFMFCKAHDNSAIIKEEFSSVITHIAKALYDHLFAFDALCKTYFLHVFLYIAQLAYAIVYAKTRSFSTATNATLRDRFAGDTSKCIHFPRFERSIGIHDPAHFTCAG